MIFSVSFHRGCSATNKFLFVPIFKVIQKESIHNIINLEKNIERRRKRRRKSIKSSHGLDPHIVSIPRGIVEQLLDNTTPTNSFFETTEKDQK